MRPGAVGSSLTRRTAAHETPSPTVQRVRACVSLIEDNNIAPNKRYNNNNNDSCVTHRANFRAACCYDLMSYFTYRFGLHLHLCLPLPAKDCHAPVRCGPPLRSPLCSRSRCAGATSAPSRFIGVKKTERPSIHINLCARCVPCVFHSWGVTPGTFCCCFGPSWVGQPESFSRACAGIWDPSHDAPARRPLEMALARPRCCFCSWRVARAYPAVTLRVLSKAGELVRVS